MVSENKTIQTPAKPRCSIVIRAYNEEEHIGRLLEGILQQTIRRVEIVLVDSGSSDATMAIANRYPVQVVHIQPDDFTFGRSLNLGLALTKADLVVIASAHVYPVYPDWLERLLAPFNDPQVGLTYGKQRGNASTRFSERQIFAQWFPETPNPQQPYPFCNNANAAIRRVVWEDTPYDETLSGLEDLAWARQILQQGFQLSYVPEAEVVHVHNESPRGVFNRYRREAMAFKHIFPQEDFGLGDFLRLASTSILSDMWHALRQGRLWSNLGDIFWFRTAQFWGTYQGYRHAGPLTWRLRQTFYYPRGLRAGPQDKPRPVEPIRYNDPL